MQTQRALRTAVSKWMLVTLVSGLAGSAMLAELARQRNLVEARDAFGLLSTQVADRLAKRIQLYEYGMRGLRGAVLMTGAQGLDRERFHRYSASRDIDQEFAGARGFGFIRRVPADQVDTFLAKARADGSPDFRIIELAPNAGERFVIQYIEPLARNLPAVGLDVASEANRRQAAIRSMQAGQAVMTGPITLVQKTGERRRSVLFLLPIYQPGMPVDTVERREAACIGWSYAALSLEEVLSGPQSGNLAFGMTLADVTDDGRAELLFQTPAPDTRVNKGLSRTVMLTLYGRKWRVELHEREGFADSLSRIDPWWVLGGGVVLTLLLATLVALLGQGRERRRIAAAHQGQLATIVENSADAIIGEAMDGTVISWNRAAERLFGYTEAQVLGQPLAPLILPANRFHEDLSLLQRIGRGDEVIPPFDTTRRHRDGTEIDVSVTAGAMRGERRELIGVAKLLRDIRERKEAERRLRELAASLERQVQDRTAALRQATQAAEAASNAKGMFLANMSHEIRTPMNAVIGAAHLLEATELDDEQRRLLARVQTAGRSLLGIINDVLDLAKIEAGELQIDSQPFSPGEVMDDVEQLFAGTAADKGIALKVTGRQALPPRLAGDAMRLRQVLVNLVGNAVKFTQEGHVELSVALDGDAEGPVVWLDWTVRDTGIGMSPEAIEKLFAPFTQADVSTTRRFGGTGLGLSIVHQLVTLMGGRIAVESEPDQGSVFRVRLPFEAADEEDVRYVTQPQPLGAGWLRGLRILLVDDSAINLEIGRGLLELEGAVVVTAANGQEALDRLHALRGFDAVLMDLQMPVMDGYEAARRIRDELGLKDLPVLALTAGALSEEKHKAEAAGLDAFLTKPLDPAAMVRTLRKVVERARDPS